MDIIQIARYLDQLLDIENIKDSARAVNGLQVQNTAGIRKVGLAVDACQATIEMAIKRDCQMMFVHHGIFWGGLQPVRGPHFDKLSAMMKADIGLYSAHLPLDMHPVLGNNRALADKIGLEHAEVFGEYEGQLIGLKGKVKRQSAKQLGKTLGEKLGAEVKVIGDGEVERVGLVTGGAGDIVGQAVKEGLDCYITGEGANHQYHEAIEGGCVLMFAGHYATETGGVQAVGKHLEQQFGLESEFLHYPTGL
jgi:dinuclear metal center YbgI/SA1388 family protein